MNEMYFYFDNYDALTALQELHFCGLFYITNSNLVHSRKTFSVFTNSQKTEDYMSIQKDYSILLRPFRVNQTFQESFSLEPQTDKNSLQNELPYIELFIPKTQVNQNKKYFSKGYVLYPSRFSSGELFNKSKQLSTLQEAFDYVRKLLLGKLLTRYFISEINAVDHTFTTEKIFIGQDANEKIIQSGYFIEVKDNFYASFSDLYLSLGEIFNSKKIYSMFHK